MADLENSCIRCARMAGTLFIIWIPCEKYERVISNKQIWDNVELRPDVDPQNINNSSDEETNYKDSKHSSMETFAVSIESDSLNRDDKKNDGTCIRKNMKRTKSVDDLSTSVNCVKGKNWNSNDNPQEKGSMDSDRFERMMKQRAEIQANEEAVDKFFGANLQRPQLDETTPMERIVREMIEKIRIKNASWVRVNSGNSYQVTFSLGNGVRCDDAIHMLSEYGIGMKEGSSIAIIPCNLYNDRHRLKQEEHETSSGQSVLKETAWNKFIGTVRARMNVAKIVDAVKADASITFDFTVLLIVASILACFGLVENSMLFLAASMLISPLMGPILAATFGAVIKDHKLQYWGIANEIIGIFMCIFVGFMFGLICCGFDFAFDNTKELTQEIMMRTNFHSVVVGICIALPSGAAVAISVLGDNFGSLVGVAISASLLPPACNTGLLWSFSLMNYFFRGVGTNFEAFVKEKRYSKDLAVELLYLGCISLCVTLTNVLCIYAMGFLFLKVKEVAPTSDDQRQFWKHDIKIARDYNKTIHADEGEKMREELALFHENASENFKGVGAELLKQTHFSHSNTLTMRHHRKEIYNERPSLHDLDKLYLNLAGKNVNTEKHHRHFSHNRSSPPHEILIEQKRSLPIFAGGNQSLDYSHCGSAPLPTITEMSYKIQHESTLVSIEGQAGPSGINKKKFTVTKAEDPLI